MRARISIVVSVAVAMLAVSPSVQAGSECTYDEGTDSVTVIVGGASRTRLFVDTGGDIKVNFNGAETDCGDATTANTTSININGTSNPEAVTVSQNGAGLFPPSISFLIRAEGGIDPFRLIGSSGADTFRFGIFDGPAAADLYGNGTARIALIDVESFSARMLGGADSVTGRPGAGFDGPLTMALEAAGNGGQDIVIGGTVGDRLSGGGSVDNVKGLAGGDALFGGGDDDNLSGGPGFDDCNGGPGDDRLRGCESES